MEQTDNVKEFVALNSQRPVTAGQVNNPRKGGGTYWISDIRFDFTLAELRSMPMPKWPWDFPDYQNTREQGEFGEGCTIRRAPEHG